MQKPVAENQYFTFWAEVDPSGQNDKIVVLPQVFLPDSDGKCRQMVSCRQKHAKPVAPLRFVSDGKSGHRVPRIPEW